MGPMNHRFIGEAPLADCGLLLIRKKQPYLDWARAFEEEGAENPYKASNSSAYLIPLFEKTTEVETFVKAHFEVIFEEELASWMEAPETWPVFTFENFKEWFTLEYIDMVYDLVSFEHEEDTTSGGYNA
jgi:hypothetical protein